jgi:hypothetical protein
VEVLSAKIKVFDGNKEPLQGAYVSLYSDHGQTIEQTLITDASGVADFGQLGRSKMSYSIVAVDDSKGQFFGETVYDSPVQTVEADLDINERESSDFGRRYLSCVRPPDDAPFLSQFSLSISSTIPDDWNHDIFVPGDVIRNANLANDYEITICTADLDNGTGNVFIVSTDPENTNNKIYGYALDAPISNDASIAITYGSPAIQIDVSTNLNIINGYSLSGTFYNGEYLSYGDIEATDKEFVFTAPFNITGVQSLLFLSEGDADYEHSLIGVHNGSQNSMVLNAKMNKPMIDINANNEVTWSITGQEPIYTLVELNSNIIDVSGVSYEMNWNIISPTIYKTITMPQLPAPLSHFQHTIDHNYSEIFLKALYSESYSNLKEVIELYPNNSSHGLIPTFVEEEWEVHYQGSTP